MRDDLGTLAVGVDGIVGEKITVEAVSSLELEDERAYGTRGRTYADAPGLAHLRLPAVSSR